MSVATTKRSRIFFCFVSALGLMLPAADFDSLSKACHARVNRKKSKTAATELKPVLPASTVTSASSATVPDEKHDTVVIEPEILVADELMRKGEFGDAESLYHQVLKTNPGSLPATIGFGLALAKQFKLPAARAQFEKALKMNPDNAMAHAGLAVVMYNSLQSSDPQIRANRDKIIEEALEQCKKGLAIDARMPEAHYTMGNLYRTREELDQALTAYQEAVKIDPNYSEALSGLGLVQLKKDDIEAAEASFKKAIDANATNSTAHYGLGRAYFLAGDYEQALKELNTSLAQHQESAPGHLVRGNVHAALGESADAIKDYREALRINPETVEAYLGISEVKENDEELTAAIENLDKAIETLPDEGEFRLRRAFLAMKLGHLDEAMDAYRKLLARQPDNIKAVHGLNRAVYLKSKSTGGDDVFMASDDFKESRSLIHKATSNKKDQAECKLAKLIIDTVNGDEVETVEAFFENYKPATSAEHLVFSEMLLVRGELNRAGLELAALIKKTDSLQELLALGDTALILKDLDNAKAAFEKAAESKDKVATYKKRIEKALGVIKESRQIAEQKVQEGDALVKKKDWDKAAQEYRSAVKTWPRLASARLGLATALEKLKPQSSSNLDEAAENLRAYVSLDTELKDKESTKLSKKADSLEARAEKQARKEDAKNKNG